MQKINKILIGLIILFILILGAFVIQPTGLFAFHSGVNDKVKVGFVVPLTGKASTYALDTKDGAELALDELKKQGKDNLEFVFDDTTLDLSKAVSIATKFINIDKIKILVTISSNETLALAPITEENKVILFTPIAGSEEITGAGDYVFRNRETASYSGKIMARHLFNNNLNKIAIFTAQSANGVTYSNALRNEFVFLGGEIVANESYNPSETNFKTQLNKLLINNPKAIYVSAGTDSDAMLVVKQLIEMGYVGVIAGSTAFESTLFLDGVGNIGERVIFTSPKFDITNLEISYYARVFESKYGHNSNVWAANGYDMIMLLSDAVSKCFDDTDCIRDYLYSTENYEGVSGTFSFDENGDVEKEVIIKTVKQGEFIPYE